LVLERRPVVGVPVRCGEFMPHNEEIQTIFPDAEDVPEIFDLPSGLVSINTEAMTVFSPKMRRYELDFHGWTTDRDRFDQHLADKAQKAGARVLTSVRCLSTARGSVRTDLGTIEAKVVIGADGPLSVVAKSLGLERSWDLCPAMCTVVKGDFPPIPEMYFGPVAPGGYGWVIPKKDGANVGLGFSKLYTDRTLREIWEPFARRRGLDAGHMNGKLVPMSGPIPQTVVGNSLVVGDAAGQVMAVNGGGIPIALICGKIAGASAADCVLKGSDLRSYEREWRRQVGRPLATALRSKRLAMLAFGSQWRLETAMRILGPRRMGRTIRCRSPFP